MLNAMPDSSPGNWISSSKPVPRNPETVAMPAETDVILPISRGCSVGTNASRARRRPLNTRSRSGRRVSADNRGPRQFHRREGGCVPGQGRQVV